MTKTMRLIKFDTHLKEIEKIKWGILPSGKKDELICEWMRQFGNKIDEIIDTLNTLINLQFQMSRRI